jgi:hypothetical protein
MAHDAAAKVAMRTEMVTYSPAVEAELTCRSSGSPPEGIVLRPRFGEQHIHAYWRHKGGVRMFTGIVRFPVTSKSWAPVYDDCCYAKLVDRDGPLNGLCVVITPQEFLEAMKEYDN